MYVFSPGELVHISDVCRIRALGNHCYRINEIDYYLPQLDVVGPDLPKGFFKGWLSARAVGRKELQGCHLMQLNHEEGIGYAYAMFGLSREECLRAWDALHWDMTNAIKCSPWVDELVTALSLQAHRPTAGCFYRYFQNYSAV